LVDERFAGVQGWPLEEESLHAYLHQRHAAYAPELAAALREVELDALPGTVGSMALNSGFEELPDPWEVVGLPGDRLVLDEERYVEGRWSARVSMPIASDGRARARLQQDVSVQAGDWYDLGGAVLLDVDDGSATVEVRFVDRNRTEISTHSLPVVTDNGRWVRGTAVVRSPNGADAAEVRCVASGAGEVWFDDVHFRPMLGY